MLTTIFSFEKHVVITFIASFLWWLMVAGVIYLWIYRKKISFRYLVNIFFAVLVAWLLSEVIKKFFPTQRPFVVSGAIPLTLTWPLDSSFPSAHSSSAFALAIGLRKTDKRLFLIYFIFAVVVAIGRVVSHVHYFVDVLAGALIGVCAVLILDRLRVDKLFRRLSLDN